MKQLINFQHMNNNRVITISAAITVLLMSNSVYAQDLALGKVQKALEGFQKELTEKIIPVAAAVVLLCLAIGYAGRYIEKDTFVRWAIGVIIAGSATQIATMLLK
ncbi:VirB2 family type IV secretion system major pilin TrwL [Bartonella tribocorum]|uniref:Conjugal transfer protein n=1 Tax=Bartonella tribocorum TaxID=85701 RepID=A0A2M6USE3_9HYPH|nr:VirB2 family type IV secretion system major pilin TrwL [Bartonella tribocorum]PIT69115.1 conjugal transfer protein [Bartonella tribocorum]